MSLILPKAVPADNINNLCQDKADARLYRNLANRLCMPPTGFMLQFMGFAATKLSERRAVDAATWRAFREMVTAVYPAIPTHTTSVTSDKHVLDSVLERIVYEQLKPKLPVGATLDVHPTPIESRRFCADFGVRDQWGKPIYVEVVGSLARFAPPMTAFAERYAHRFGRKLAAYEDAGITPVLIYADEICAPKLLIAAIDQIVIRLQGVLA